VVRDTSGERVYPKYVGNVLPERQGRIRIAYVVAAGHSTKEKRAHERYAGLVTKLL
jgi:hypothetical protein